MLFFFLPFYFFLSHLPVSFTSLPSLVTFSLLFSVFFSVPGPGGWWFPLSRWPTLIIYWWQENRGRPSQLLLPGTQLSANTHTNKYRHIDSHNDSHTSMQLLKETHSLPHVKTHAKNIFPFGSFLWCHVSTLLSSTVKCDSVLHFCTFSFPPPLSSCLQRSFSHLLLWCYWLCHTGTDRKRDRGRERARLWE